jgi:hypothetical protein
MAVAHAYGPQVIAIATDGVFTTVPVTGLPRGTAPGTWDVESHMDEPLLFLQPGVMFSESGQIKKTRGFGRATLSFGDAEGESRDVRLPDGRVVTRATGRKPRGIPQTQPTVIPGLKTIWLRDNIAGVVPYHERRFVGVGGSVAAGHPELYGRWIDAERELKFWNVGGKCAYGRELTASDSYVPDPDWGVSSAPYSDIRQLLPQWEYTGVASERFIKPHLIETEGCWELVEWAREQRERDMMLDEQPDWSMFG